ncbi:MAG: hypothetical protein IPJ59_33190 [Nannocystis sp.]|nr:hypothetical protein [Nannocystis sp.]
MLRQEISADRDSPPFDRVMMDGFALRASDFAQGRRFPDQRQRTGRAGNGLSAGENPLVFGNNDWRSHARWSGLHRSGGGCGAQRRGDHGGRFL